MNNNGNHKSISDKNFLKEFEDCSLNPVLFTHEAHIRLAWLHIRNIGLKKAEKVIQQQLEKFVTFHGTNDKYHKTVTIIAIRVISQFILKSKSDNFPDFITEFPELINNFNDMISQQYSFDVYNSDRAKYQFVEPDFVFNR